MKPAGAPAAGATAMWHAAGVAVGRPFRRATLAPCPSMADAPRRGARAGAAGAGPFGPDGSGGTWAGRPACVALAR